MKLIDALKRTGFEGAGGIAPLTLASDGTAYPEIEGTYPVFSTLNSKPWYRNSSGFNINWSGTQWKAWSESNSSPQYYSAEDVATPDLVSSWTKGLAATFMTTTGAGNSVLNDTWYKDTIVNGKNPFRINDLRGVTWGGSVWNIIDAVGQYWFSTEDVASPDLVSSWTIQIDGVNPAPTFTAPVEAGNITIT